MLKDILVASKLAGGGSGGSGNLPTPSAANVGSGLVSQKKVVAGTVIVPEQTATFDEYGNAVLQGNSELFVAGTFCVGHINDYQIIGVIEEDDGWFGIGGIWYDSTENVIQIEGGEEGQTVSASLSVASYGYEYSLDPYAGYDIVIASSNFMDTASCEVVKLDYPYVYNKVVSGEPVIGIAFSHEPYNENIDGDSENRVYPLTALSLVGTPDDSVLSLRFDNIAGRKYLSSGITLEVAEFNCKVGQSGSLFYTDYSAYGKNIT